MAIKTRIEVTSDVTSTLIFLRCFSFYDEKEKRRKIKKSQASSRKIADQTVRSKNTVNKDINNLKDNSIVIEKDSWYYLKDIPKEVSSIELPQEFLAQLNRTFHQDYIKVYCWLYRELINYHQPLFSCKRLIEQALGLTYNQDRVNKVNEILYQLALNGLIVIADVKVKTTINDKATFMWKLLEIRTEFKTIDVIKNVVEQQLKGTSDFTGDVLALTESDYEVGVTIGFTSNMLEEASENEFLIEELPKIWLIKDQPPIDFCSLEEVRQILNTKYNFNMKTKEDVLCRLVDGYNHELNERYVNYLYEHDMV